MQLTVFLNKKRQVRVFISIKWDNNSFNDFIFELMKTKFLLFLILAGMITADVSCKRWGAEGEIKEEITGIYGIQLYKKDKWYPSVNIYMFKDTFAFDSLFFRPHFQTTRIVLNKDFSFIKGAYADLIPTVIVMNFDSIKIFSVIKGNETDVTNHFSVGSNFGSFPSKIDNLDPDFIKKFLVKSSGGDLFFQLNTPPVKTDSCQFNFKFFDKKGRMFEKMSQPLIISP